MSPSTLCFVVPGPLDQRTGGYLYDRRMVDGLGALGHDVRVLELAGRFPDADASAREALDAALGGVEAGAVTVVDGLAGGGLPGILEKHARRLRLIALVHHPLADETGLEPAEAERFHALEQRALASCRGVIVTSRFTAARLTDFDVPEARIRVVEPGTARARTGAGPPTGRPARLLSVASITPRKGHDVLIRALAACADLPWTCAFAGSEAYAPEHAARIRSLVTDGGLERRIEFLGELDAATLDRRYRDASLFVLASHYEGYGMALTEALARGVPVLSTTGGAIPFTVPAGAGVLVPPGDAEALARALVDLLAPCEGRGPGQGPSLATLRRGALAHAARLPDWPRQAKAFGAAVANLSGRHAAP